MYSLYSYGDWEVGVKGVGGMGLGLFGGGVGGGCVFWFLGVGWRDFWGGGTTKGLWFVGMMVGLEGFGDGRFLGIEQEVDNFGEEPGGVGGVFWVFWASFGAVLEALAGLAGGRGGGGVGAR